MPLILNNDGTTTFTGTAPVKNDPKFFSNLLTGRGSSVGVLCEDRNPRYITQNLFPDIQPAAVASHPETCVNGNVTISTIPIHWMPLYWLFKCNASFEDLKSVPGLELTIDDALKKQKIGTDPAFGELYFHLSPYGIQIDKTDATATTKRTTRVHVFYQMAITAIRNSAEPRAALVKSLDDVRKLPANTNFLYLKLSADPQSELREFIHDRGALSSAFRYDQTALRSFFDGYSLYDSVCRVSELWQQHLADSMETLIDDLRYNLGQIQKPYYLSCGEEAAWDLLFHTASVSGNYNAPLTDYIRIYKKLEVSFPADVLKRICRANINYLMTSTLAEMNQKQTQCARLPIPKNPITIDPSFSAQQKAAIQSTSPLNLIQAVAGSGKSTTIFGRIKYMKDCGVPGDDITVISFTNAAADHITDVDPTVRSMTFDKFIGQIYNYNFPNHEISTLKILINTLSIYFPNNADIQEFKNHLHNLDTRNWYLPLCNFVEEHFDQVIGWLNSVHQTTLELQTIIAYLKIETLQMAPDMLARYLIIDEVQDNSKFQFIYAMKYTARFLSNLFIVGDCAQTLYEFRNADPKALNTLEASNVFATHQLTTNYRSAPEILAMANTLLKNIEANQFANLRLRSNSLQPVTQTSFKNAVHFSHIELNSTHPSNLKEAIPEMCNIYLKKWMDAKLAAGEKVALLCRYNKAGAGEIEKMIRMMYPQYRVNNISAINSKDSLYFSNYIRKRKKNLIWMPSAQLLPCLKNDLLNSLTNSRNKNAVASASQWFDRWATENRMEINAWISDHISGHITVSELQNHICDSMLDFEIKNNSIRQNLIRQERDQNRDQDADIIISTIHSCKGLEFDNVAVLYQTDNNMSEEDKRLYYVAFTRAKKSLYMMAASRQANPRIETTYNRIVDSLPL